MKRLLAAGIAAGLFACSAGDTGTITASGTIEAVEVTVNAKMGGAIVHLAVDEGTDVKKGDTLARVDSANLEIQLKQARANVAAAKAQYSLVLRGFRREDTQQAEANYRFARAEFERVEDIFRQGSATRRQYDEAKSKADMARMAYEKLENGFLPEEKDAARARVRLARAQREQVEKMIRDAEITSPIDGKVTQKSVEEGDDVLPNSQLFRISRLDTVHLMIYVTEIELAKVKLGREAAVFIDAYPQRPYKGKITYISPVAEFTPKNVQTKDDRAKLVFGVKIEIANPDLTLKPGMPADARLDAGK
jgi:HlyD family secretion protein